MADDKPVYLDLEGYMVVRADYHCRLAACIARAELKLEQFKESNCPEALGEVMEDRIKLLGFILGTEDAL